MPEAKPRTTTNPVSPALPGETPSAGSIEVRGVTKSFGRHRVLDGVSFTVSRGDVVCMIGPSGSGKSTMLRCINRLEEPDGGDILLDGESTLAMPVDRMRQRIGMVFQQFNLFPHRTVLDNIAMPLRSVRKLSRDAARIHAREGLDKVGLAGKADFRPSRLSGGQQQRVAIARALAMDPEVMLFDESTSALDPELVKGVLGLMADLAAGGMTMIVVTHEMGFARNVADGVVFMDRGALIEQGSPSELFDRPTTERLQQFLADVL